MGPSKQMVRSENIESSINKFYKMLIASLTAAVGTTLVGDLASTFAFLATGCGVLIKFAVAEVDDDALASLSGR